MAFEEVAPLLCTPVNVIMAFFIELWTGRLEFDSRW